MVSDSRYTPFITIPNTNPPGIPQTTPNQLNESVKSPQLVIPPGPLRLRIPYQPQMSPKQQAAVELASGVVVQIGAVQCDFDLQRFFRSKKNTLLLVYFISIFFNFSRTLWSIFKNVCWQMLKFEFWNLELGGDVLVPWSNIPIQKPFFDSNFPWLLVVIQEGLFFFLWMALSISIQFSIHFIIILLCSSFFFIR